MTGHQFRAIRRFNGITQEDICRHSKYGHRASVYRIEQMQFIPEKFVQILSKIIRINLHDQQVVDCYFMQLPDKYKDYEPRRSSNDLRDSYNFQDMDGNKLSKENLFG